MPKVYLTKEQYKQERIGAWVSGMLYKERKTFADLGEVLGISRQAACYKARHNSFSYLDMVRIFEFFGSPDEEILQVMRF